MLLAIAAVFLRPRKARRSASPSAGPDPLTIVGTSPVFAAGLLIFYSWFGVTWYFTRYLAPVAVVTVLLIATGVGRLVQSSRGVRPVGIAVVVTLLVFPVVTALRLDTQFLTADHRLATPKDAATGYAPIVQMLVRRVPRDAVAAGWQSGAVTFWAGERFTVLNLDGVVNPGRPSVQQTPSPHQSIDAAGGRGPPGVVPALATVSAPWQRSGTVRSLGQGQAPPTVPNKKDPRVRNPGAIVIAAELAR